MSSPHEDAPPPPNHGNPTKNPENGERAADERTLEGLLGRADGALIRTRGSRT